MARDRKGPSLDDLPTPPDHAVNTSAGSYKRYLAEGVENGAHTFGRYRECWWECVESGRGWGFGAFVNPWLTLVYKVHANP